MATAGSRRTTVSPRAPRPAWIAKYTWRLVLSDAIAIALAVGLSHLFWFGLESVEVAGRFTVQVSYLIVSVILVAGWLAMLKFFGTRDPRIVGSGLTEYARTADATLRFFGLIAIFAVLLQAEVARGYIITAFPIGLFLILVGRWSWRQWLREERYKGRHLMRVLLVGSAESVEHLASQLAHHAYAGYRVVAVCLTRPGDEELLAPLDVPIYTDLAVISDLVRSVDAHAVALAGSEGLPAKRVRRVSWDLESTGVDLMVAPSLTDIAGTRVHTRPVAGLPLLYVESPRYEGPAKTIKLIFDVAVATVLVILFTPILIAIAIVTKMTSRGPVLFRQERIGLNGQAFDILKFRSMRLGADDELADLLREQESDSVPLFKVSDDPRVTRVGRVLRAYSLDELPQLFNVIKGDMSLVGPRPQRPEEVALYDPDATRRLLVKPGMTGLWQVSGRSDMTWDEALHLDLYYVENWSLTDDLVILLRTFRVVLIKSGAR